MRAERDGEDMTIAGHCMRRTARCSVTRPAPHGWASPFCSRCSRPMVGFRTALRRFPSRRSRRSPARSRCRQKPGAAMTGAVGPPRITGHKSATPSAFARPRWTIPTLSRVGWKARCPRWNIGQIDCWWLHASGAGRSASSRHLLIASIDWYAPSSTGTKRRGATACWHACRLPRRQGSTPCSRRPIPMRQAARIIVLRCSHCALAPATPACKASARKPTSPRRPASAARRLTIQGHTLLCIW